MDIESLNYLKESPMFQLSLTSKELFHSNFISWVLSNYKKECSKHLSKFLSLNKNQEIICVMREEENKDIVIYFQNELGYKSSIIIENKVKSIPSYEQLRRYTTGEDSEHYILLSLTKPTFLTKAKKIKIHELGREWDYIDYYDLAEMFEQIIPKVTEKNKYHALIIEDYVNSIKILQSLTNEIYEHLKDGIYDFYQKQNNFLDTLKEIRLHDFYLKLNHEIIAAELQERIEKEISNINLVANKNWKKGIANEIFTGSGFTRGSGISEVKYVIGEKYDSPVIVGVQLQHVQFRLFIESKKGYAIKLAQKLFDEGLWFDFSRIKDSSIKTSQEYPGIKGSNKIFNTYSSEFFYRSVKISCCKIKDLVEIFMAYTHFIHNEKERFLRIIDDL